MRTIVVLIAAALSIGAQPSTAPGVPWNRTADAFAGKYVIVKLTSGTRIEGHWSRVTSTTFTMNVKKTTNKGEIQKGLQTARRSSIESVRAGVRRARGRAWGVLGGLFIASAAAQGVPSAAAVRYLALISIAGGYVAGSAYDLATDEVTLLPEVP